MSRHTPNDFTVGGVVTADGYKTHKGNGLVNDKFNLGTSAVKLNFNASDPLVSIQGTSDDTTGLIRSGVFNTTMTAASTANEVENFASIVTSAVRTGDWCNAILGKVDYSTAGFATGIAGAICAEIDLAPVAIGAGSYCCFEAEINVPASSTGFGSTVPLAFLTGNAWGAGVAAWRSGGYVFNFTGLGSVGSSNIIQANTDQATHAIRVLIDGTPYFMLMTTVNNGTE